MTRCWLSNQAQHKLGEAIYKKFETEYIGYRESVDFLMCNICKKEIENGN